jgi:hypothetical protein
MYTPSDEMFLASPLTDPFSVITLTGHRTSVRGEFRFSTKLLNALYLKGFLILVSHNHKAVKLSGRGAFLRDEISGRLLAMKVAKKTNRATTYRYRQFDFELGELH